jgi:hypothetical protein
MSSRSDDELKLFESQPYAGPALARSPIVVIAKAKATPMASRRNVRPPSDVIGGWPVSAAAKGCRVVRANVMKGSFSRGPGLGSPVLS